MVKTAKSRELETLFRFRDKAIIFSPHLDDSVLSMGGMIEYLIKHDIQVTIINVFTKCSDLETRFTQRLVLESGFSSAKEYFKAREKEDKKAIEALGKNIKAINLGLVEAAWRGSKNNKSYYPATTLNYNNHADNEIFPEILRKIKELRIDADKFYIFAPLARGRDVDHILLRNACLNLFDSLIYYSDLQYSHKFPNEEAFIKEKKLSKFEFEFESRKKEKAVSAYKSQMESFSDFPDFHKHPEVFYLV